MMQQFKENILKGYYRDHNKGAELLDIDMEVVLENEVENLKKEIVLLLKRLDEKKKK